MSDHAKFLAAVIAAPDDDLPRLIFADWLDEHGEPERAAFIRVQCELANAPWEIRGPRWNDLRYCAGEPWDALRRRERELWAAIDLSELPGHTHARSVESWVSTSVARFDFRRGFVEEVTCPWNREHVAAIQKATPLRRVRLTTTPGMDFDGDGAGGSLRHVWLMGGKQRLGVVRPALIYGLRQKIIADLLAAEFPGVEFELPPAQQAGRHGSGGHIVVDGQRMQVASWRAVPPDSP